MRFATSALLGSPLRRNLASGVGASVVGVAITAASYPLYLGFLGYERYGTWLVLATVISFAQLGNIGLNTALEKLVAEALARSDRTAAQALVTTASVVLAAVTVALLLVAFSLRDPLVRVLALEGENAEIVRRFLPAIAAVSGYVLQAQALQGAVSGIGRMDVASVLGVAGKAASLAVAVALLAAGMGIEALLVGSAASAALLHLGAMVVLRRHAGLRLLDLARLDRQAALRLIRFGSGVFAGTAVVMLLGPLHKLLVARFVGVAAVAIYEIAYTGTMQVRALLEAGLRALVPESSRLQASGEALAHERLRSLLSKADRLVLASAPLFLALLAFAPVALRLWLGARYDPAVLTPFRVMTVAALVSLAGVPPYYVLLGLGKVRLCLQSYVLQSGASLAVIAAAFALTGDLALLVVIASVLVGFVLSTGFLHVRARAVLGEMRGLAGA